MPKTDYLNACARTIFLHKLLKTNLGFELDLNKIDCSIKKIEFDILNGLDLERVDVYEKTIDQSDLVYF